MFGPALSMFEELLYHPKNGLMWGLRPILSYLCSSLEKETGKFHVLKLTKKKKKCPYSFLSFSILWISLMFYSFVFLNLRYLGLDLSEVYKLKARAPG